MKTPTLIALSLSACLGVAACAGEDTANEAASEGTAAAAEADSGDLIVEDQPQDDGNGSRFSIGPDGAELEVDGDEVDARVSSEGDPSLDVEF